MTFIQGLLIFLAVILGYAVLIAVLKVTGLFKKHELKFYGPALMIRTKRGIGFLKKLASKKRQYRHPL